MRCEGAILSLPLPSVEARHLCVGYGREPVLDAVSFAFVAGGINVILGPGGAGKSTLLRALGAEPAAAASPWVRGELILPGTPAVSMAQKPRPRRSPFERLLRTAPGQGPAPKRLIRQVWRSVPEVVGLLEPALEVPINQLPYPQVRLAELTLALAGAPYVLLDEPEVGLEEGAREWVVRCLRDLRGHRTLVLATHHLGVARRLADFALLLSEGTVVESGPNPPFFERPRLARTRRFVTMGS